MKQLSAFWEMLWPWLFAVLVAVAWIKFGAPFPAQPDNLFSVAGTVASVLASFLGVSKAIILSIKSTPTYAALQRLKYTDTLYRFLRTGIYCSILFAAISILGFFIDRLATFREISIFQAYCLLWVFVGSLALFTYLRISNIMFKLLRAA